MKKMRQVDQFPQANLAAPFDRRNPSNAFTELLKRCFDLLACSKRKPSKAQPKQTRLAAMNFNKSSRGCARTPGVFFKQSQATRPNFVHATSA
jgi:hypothetical protein